MDDLERYEKMLRELSLPDLRAKHAEAHELASTMRSWSPYYPMARRMEDRARRVLAERVTEQQ